MPGGSHNRVSKVSLAHVLSSKGKKRLCKCPLHRNGGRGTLVFQTEFKRHGENGVQGMCATGKTLIDSYSHTLKRLQLLAVVDPEEAFLALDNLSKEYESIVRKIKK